MSLASNASSNVDVRAIARAVSRGGSNTSAASAQPFASRDLPVLIEVPDGDDPTLHGLSRIGTHFSAVKAPLADLVSLAAAHPRWRVTWSAPMRLLLDRATAWGRVPEFRNDTGLSGTGVVVGIVDAGIDVRHPDLRKADGTTRIAYLVDFSRDATGKHPDEEERCKKAGFPCGVFSAAEIDALVAAQREADIPNDPDGHGTHVASLAAGNGGDEGKYVGVAPEASLVVARVADASGSIDASVIPLATDLVFHFAETMGHERGLDRVPAVANLSLGQDFGNHDGNSAIEKSLGELVGSNHPGRCIVAAAGNSATIYTGNFGYPNPFGIHTEVNVPERSSIRVPMVALTRPKNLSGNLYVWISFRPSDSVSVGIDQNDGPILQPVAPGNGNKATRDQVTVAVVNGTLKRDGYTPDNVNAAVAVVGGTWPSSKTFAIRLEGHGTASLWLQGDGDFADGPVFFPAASKEATIASPAASPSIIAVGATLNRTEWVDRDGKTIPVPTFGGVANPEPDSVAYFSAAGPTSDLRMKPDIVAPGAFVVGAMARSADPTTNAFSSFFDPGCGDPNTDCPNVVDDEHGVLSGTSMSAPIVAGAVALLFQEKPDSTPEEIRTLLQAGARLPTGLVRLRSQLGPGALDLVGVRDVEAAMRTPVVREPDSGRSWMSVASGYAHPDAAWRIPGVLELRDGAGRVADGFDTSALAVDADPGLVVEPLERVAPGLYRFAVAAGAGTGGDTLRVSATYRSEVLAETDLPIAVDVNVAREGFSARGGCVAAGAARRSTTAPWPLAIILFLGRRRIRAARTARSRGRTDTSVRSRPSSCPRRARPLPRDP